MEYQQADDYIRQSLSPKQKAAPANSRQAAMNRLWDSGAAAKHRGDYAAARKDWNRILELTPGHPGIQEAINKLPQ